jgi:hypothetical protein
MESSTHPAQHAQIVRFSVFDSSAYQLAIINFPLRASVYFSSKSTILGFRQGCILLACTYDVVTKPKQPRRIQPSHVRDVLGRQTVSQ